MRSHNLRGNLQIAVIGGNGFIGRAFINRLSNYKNLRIFSLDNKYNKVNLLSNLDDPSKPVSIHAIRMDVSNPGAISGWLAAHPVDVIVFAAGFENPTDGLSVTCVEDTNSLLALSRTLAALDEMQLEKWEEPPYFLYLSSHSVYGAGRKEKSEGCKEYPSNYSGMNKLTAEDLVKRVCTKLSIPHGILRLSEVYGRRDFKELRRRHYWPGYLSYYLDKIIRKEDPLLVFSPNSYLDLVDVNYVTLVMRHFIENQIQGIYNVASGDTLKIKDLIFNILQEYNKLNGTNLSIKIEDRRDLSVDHMLLDVNKVHSMVPYDLDNYNLGKFLIKYLKVRQYEIAKDMVIEDVFAEPLVLDSTAKGGPEEFKVRQARRKIVYSKIREVGGEQFFNINVGKTVERYESLLSLELTDELIDKARLLYFHTSSEYLTVNNKHPDYILFPEDNVNVYELIEKVLLLDSNRESKKIEK